MAICTEGSCKRAAKELLGRSGRRSAVHAGALAAAEARAHLIAFVMFGSVGRGCAKEHPVQRAEKTLRWAPKRVSSACCEKYSRPGGVVSVGTVRGFESR
jgi:hypothetical protein